MEGFQVNNARTSGVEIGGWNYDPGCAGEAGGLRSVAEISAAGGDSRRANGHGHLSRWRGSLLPDRTFRGEGSADTEAQLSRVGRLWRKVPVVECAQSGAGRLSGRDLGRGFADRERRCG